MIARANASRAAAQAAIDVLRINRLSRDHILAEARSLHTRWPELPRDQKRQIVETITDRITVGREDIDILLHYVPTTAIGTNGPDGEAVQPGKPRKSASGANALNKATQEFGFVRGRLGGIGP